MNKKKLLGFLLSLILLVLLPSCTVTQNLVFSSEKSNEGSGKTNFEASPFFVSVLEDLTAWQESTKDADILDSAVSEMWNIFDNSMAADNVLFTKTGTNSYSGTFAFNDFAKLIEDISSNYKDQKFITLTDKENVKRFELNICLETYDVLATIVPILNDENFKVWGPVYNNPPYDEISEEDYKNMVAWTLGEDGPEAIDNSVITIKLSLPTEVSSTNGELLDSKTVSFSFPLIDFLLLHEPIVFFCEF